MEFSVGTAAAKLAARLARLTGTVKPQTRRDLKRAANLAGKAARYVSRSLDANYGRYRARKPAENVDAAA